MSIQRVVPARSSRLLFLSLCVGLVLSPGRPLGPAVALAAASPPEASAAGPGAPTLRLPTLAVPQRYALDLTLVPADETFTGRIDVDLNILSPTSVLWLNKSPELTVLEASLLPT